MQATGWRIYAPWLDRKGGFWPLGAVCFALLLVPALLVAFDGAFGRLGPKPWTQAVHDTGTWAVRLLLVSLAVSPLRRILDWNKLIGVRRMIGVSVMAYGLLHLTLYCIDLGFDWGLIVSEIVRRFYLVVGITALIGLVALGLTSTDAMIRRMGGRNWQRLHNLVYAITGLALLHFALQSKIDVTQPAMMTGLFGLLLIYRLAIRLKWPLTPLNLALVALGAGLLTALCETAWYAFATGASAFDVFQANFDIWYYPGIDMLRPGHWVALAGLGVAAIALVRRPAAPRERRREATA